MPLSDRTNVPTAPVPRCSLPVQEPCKGSVSHPRPPLSFRFPKDEAELAQYMAKDPEFLKRVDFFYKRVTPFSLLRAYFSWGSYYMNPSLQPTTSTKRTIAIGFPRRRECYSANLTSTAKGVPTIEFFKNGVPGPFLKELLENSLIDDPDDMVIERNSEEEIYFYLDWPCVNTQKRWYRTYDGTSRIRLARNIANHIHYLMFKATFTNRHFYHVHPFSPKNIPFNALRIFSVERYGDVWIPTLGMDIQLG
ncbi:hypothetical protein M413DRAFT_116090 [Hebeloma cylindrosporum]|uniref:Uncharacterized protein n=1 Tax=Hebeloma cylindrosporum TaxID=76867 RepID=A0A0C3CM72_HEBCY|nr:hypothetical protein M413DRAFT_116090 [Hebeloma cylindrosporum h7]